MRILYVTAHYPPDFVSGATLQVQRLAERAAAAGHRVTVFSGAINAGLADGTQHHEHIDGVDVRWIGTAGLIEQHDDRNWHNPAATAAVADLLDRVAPDVVHAHTLQTLGAGPLTEAARRGIRTVVTMHDLWWWCSRLFLVDRDLRPCPLVVDASDCECARTASWRRGRTAALWPALRDVSEILVPSGAMRDLVIANGISPTRVSVDENDVDTRDDGDAAAPSQNDESTDAFSARSPTGVGGKRAENASWRDLRRERRGGDRRPAGDPVRFVYIGGDSPLKGADVVLDAARRLRRLPGWTLTTYGMSAARRRASRHDGPIVFRPPFEPSEIAEVLGAGDVLIIPSLARESYSIAAREALGAGLAVLTSDCLGPEEVVHHDVNGVVVPTGDAAALSEAMRRLVEHAEEVGRLRDGALSTPVRLRTPDDHTSALLARYHDPPPEAPLTPPGRVAIVVGAGDRYGMSRTATGTELPRPSRAARLRDALTLHGAVVLVVDAHRPDLPEAVADADVVIVTGETPSTVAAALDPRPSTMTVVYDAADIADTERHERFAWCDTAIASSRQIADDVAPVTGLATTVVPDALGVDELRAATARPPSARRRPWARVSRRRTSVVIAVLTQTYHTMGGAGLGAGRGRPTGIPAELLDEPAPGIEVTTVDGGWRTRIEHVRRSDIVVVPPTDDPTEATSPVGWMYAAACGKPAVVTISGEMGAIVDDGRTALCAREPGDWQRHVRRLAGDATARAIIGVAAQRAAALHHGPHVTAHALLAALADPHR